MAAKRRAALASKHPVPEEHRDHYDRARAASSGEREDTDCKCGHAGCKRCDVAPPDPYAAHEREISERLHRQFPLGFNDLNAVIADQQRLQDDVRLDRMSPKQRRDTARLAGIVSPRDCSKCDGSGRVRHGAVGATCPRCKGSGRDRAERHPEAFPEDAFLDAGSCEP
jgi:hypothetical protein